VDNYALKEARAPASSRAVSWKKKGGSRKSSISGAGKAQDLGKRGRERVRGKRTLYHRLDIKKKGKKGSESPKGRVRESEKGPSRKKGNHAWAKGLNEALTT